MRRGGPGKGKSGTQANQLQAGRKSRGGRDHDGGPCVRRESGRYGNPLGRGSSEGPNSLPLSTGHSVWPQEVEISLTWLQPKARVRLGPGWA